MSAAARLTIWPREERSRDPGRAVAVLELSAAGARILSGGDAALAALVRELAAEPHLPLAARRPLPGGGRAVGVHRPRPGDVDYPRAFADALARRTAYLAEEA